MLRLQIEYPIRNDFANMEILSEKEYEKLADKVRDSNNYLVKHEKEFVLHINNYKTSKRLGKKEYQLKPNICRLLLSFFKINDSDYLFVKPSNRTIPLSESDITKQFNIVFKKYYPDKSISTSMIRHILISHDRLGGPTIKEQQIKNKAIEDKYLHSKQLNDQYNKK